MSNEAERMRNKARSMGQNREANGLSLVEAGGTKWVKS